MAKKQITIGVRRGAGEPPYQWGVSVLVAAFRDAMDFLSAAQYRHLASQMRRLAREADPTHSGELSVDAIEDFYELRDWGGPLQKLNVRIFFGLDRAWRAIVVLGAIAKKNNGPTPPAAKQRMRGRWRQYRDGDFF